MASKGAIPWNKGLSKDTDKRVLKNANSRKGKGSEKTKQAHEKRRIEVLGVHYDLLNKPDQWKITCTGCKVKEIVYVRFKRFHTNLLTIESGKDVLCNSCDRIGRKPSDEAKLNMSKAAKTRKIDPVNETIRSNKIREAHKNRYSNMSPEERADLTDRISNGYKTMDPEKKKRHYQRVSECNIERILRTGPLDRFIPGYNISTIQIIDTVLSEQYNTKFMHAENGGEFKIYDREVRKFYYADAYSPELNLWIEFDEKKKFKNNSLPVEHLIREERIKILTGCEMIRIKVA